MNSIRKLVSGNRRRMTDGDYNLDLTYITPRVIAMSYPAHGIMESFYRNPIEKVFQNLVLYCFCILLGLCLLERKALGQILDHQYIRESHL